MRFFKLILVLSLWAQLANGNTLKTVEVNFYSERIRLNYPMELQVPGRLSVDEDRIIQFYKQLGTTDYTVLLQELLFQQKRLNLNDWLFYELLDKSIDLILNRESDLKRKITKWFFLTKAGFDTRLTYYGNKVYIYVYSNDEVFEVPMIEDQGKKFINLTSINERIPSQKALYLLNFIPPSQGKSFSFYLPTLPRLQPIVRRKQLEFMYAQKWYQFGINIDLTIPELMREYPFISEVQYLKVPLSQTLTNSLLPQLQESLVGLSNKEALEFLVTLTRSSFRYREDKEHFGKSKPMIPDEVFFYPYSDCEDRSALFYNLVKELLNLPMIVIAFDDHLTIGVALEGLEGPIIRYGDHNYFICDPTGPVNSSEIGTFPTGYENQPFEIIGGYW